MLGVLIPKIPIKTYQLKNGLRVVVVADRSAPVVSVAVVYDVGSRSEREGRSGFAHLFEHMMFQGSANVTKAQHMQLIENNGGSLNGFTMKDFTAYHETLPSNQLALGLWLEADRMRSLAVTQENFDNQKDVVSEEKRWHYDNRPYMMALSDALPQLLFNKWANSHSVIGSLEDLDRATLADISQFFNTYYAPGNAVLCVAGDARPAQVLRLAKKYFGGIAPKPTAPRQDLSEKENTQVRRKVCPDRFAALPALMIGWKAPSRTHQDSRALGLLGSILFDGADSRLYQLLVKKQKWAISVEGGLGWPFGSFQTLRDPMPFGIMIHLYPQAPRSQVLDAVSAEIQKIGRGELTEDEVVRARRKFQAEILDSFQGSETLAYWLGIFTHLNDGNPNGFEAELNSYLSAVTKKDICRAAAAGYLDAGKWSVVEVEPTPQTGAGSGNGAPRPKETSQAAAPKPKQKPPVSKTPPRLIRRKVEEFKLSNGWRVLFAQDRRLPFLKWRLAFPLLGAGSTDQAHLDQWAARCDALTDLLTAGTKTKDNETLEAALASLGASLHAGAGKDHLTLSGSVLKETATDYFLLAAEILNESQFPPDELEKWKERTIAELKDQKTHAEFLRQVHFDRGLFGVHHYSITAPSEESILHVTREALMDHYCRQWTGGMISVVGDITKAELKKIFETTIGKISPRPAPPAQRRRAETLPQQKEKRLILVDRPGSVQSEISIGHMTIKRTDRDYYPLALANMVFGGLFYSRLNRNLREEKGYTYGIGSSLKTYLETGVFKIGTSVQTKVTGPALSEIFKEMELLVRRGPTQEEIRNAKNYMVGLAAIGQATQDHLADQLINYAILGLPTSELYRFRKKIQSVSRAQAQHAARRYFNLDRALVVVVGDAARIAADLKAIASAEIINAEGQPVSIPQGVAAAS